MSSRALAGSRARARRSAWSPGELLDPFAQSSPPRTGRGGSPCRDLLEDDIVAGEHDIVEEVLEGDVLRRPPLPSPAGTTSKMLPWRRNWATERT